MITTGEFSMSRYLEIFLLSLFFTGFILMSYSCAERKIRLEITTVNAYDIKQTSAFSGGNLYYHTSMPIIDKGLCWGITPNPTLKDNVSSSGSGKSNYTGQLTGLLPGTEYFVRAYVISGPDTLYGDNILFYTEDYSFVTDVDDNVYNTINIGSQTWMAENLKTTRYNDGEAIPLVKDEKEWAGLSAPGYCWYRNDDEAFKQDYGALYNWYAINTELLCPAGWHTPNDYDWMVLTILLGGETNAGGKLKQPGFSYWVEPNTGATNDYGFNALPGGFRYSDGKFYDFGFSAYWWTSGDISARKAYFRFIYYTDRNLYRFNNDKTNGYSIRCIKDL